MATRIGGRRVRQGKRKCQEAHPDQQSAVVPNAIGAASRGREFRHFLGDYTLYNNTSQPHVIRLLMSAFVCPAENNLRVGRSPIVGGRLRSKIYH